MGKVLQNTICAFMFVSLAAPAFSQSESFAYAVTDMSQAGKNWVALRKLDFRSGNFSDLILDGTSRNIPVMDVKGGRAGKMPVPFGQNIEAELPFANGVAAIAYAHNSNRIFFVPMYVDQLRYVDLSTMKVFTAGNGFGGASPRHILESFTRMVIGSDGNGYVLSTDGNHLYSFNTTGVPQIKDLGPLKDGPENGHMSILNNSCITAGGDMIADDAGDLYLIAARNHVYKISLKDMVASYLGQIKGLPTDFSSNGAAVDHEGKVLVTSSVFAGQMFQVDPFKWEAKPYQGSAVYNAADLGSSNFLATGRRPRIPAVAASMRGAVKVFPNPVRSNSFKVNFSNMRTGEYFLELTDAAGRRVMQRKINIMGPGYVETINLPGTSTKGIYMVRLLNAENQQVSIEKILVERLK